MTDSRSDAGTASSNRRVRRKPYTERGLRRLSCVRCGKEATEQWNVRSCRARVNWGYLPLCDVCDDELNALVLGFFRTKRVRGMRKVGPHMFVIDRPTSKR